MINRGDISPKADKERPPVLACPIIDENYFDHARPHEHRISDLESKHESKPLLAYRRRRTPPDHRNTRLKQIFKQSKRKAPKVGGKMIDTFRHYASWMAYLPNVISMARAPAALLRITEFLAPSIRLINGFRLLYRAVFEIKEKWTRAVSALGGLANISFAIASFIVPSLAIIFVTANIATNLSLGLWSIGVALKNRLGGAWSKLCKDLKREEREFYSLLAGNPKQFESFKQFKRKNPSSYADNTNLTLSNLEHSILEKRNHHTQLKADIAIKAYNTGILLIALTGIIMCFFPPTMLIGATFLLATAVHGAFFGYDLAGHWPQKVQDFFFKSQTTASIPELEKKVARFAFTTSKLNEKLKAHSLKLRMGDQSLSLKPEPGLKTIEQKENQSQVSSLGKKRDIISATEKARKYWRRESLAFQMVAEEPHRKRGENQAHSSYPLSW